MTFKDRVREEMKFQGLTAKELASKAEISVNTLNMYIGYKNSMPSAEVALKLAKALSVSLEYLVNGTNNVVDENSKNNTEKLTLQKQILSITNTMTQTQLENFLQVTKLFAAISAK